MIIGILSDTHGYLRNEVVEGLKNVDHIIHAGDIDNKAVIDSLKKIAPVTVVRGNADKEWAEYLPDSATLDVSGNRIFIIHNKGKIKELPSDTSIIIYGHTHKYSLAEKDGITWFNPGCCGKRRPGQEVSYAILKLHESGDFDFQKVVIDTSSAGAHSSQKTSLPKNIDKIISKAMSMTNSGKSYQEIAKKLKISEELAESICRMYLTHPGVDVAGILQRIS